MVYRPELNYPPESCNEFYCYKTGLYPVLLCSSGWVGEGDSVLFYGKYGEISSKDVALHPAEELRG